MCNSILKNLDSASLDKYYYKDQYITCTLCSCAGLVTAIKYKLIIIFITYIDYI